MNRISFSATLVLVVLAGCGEKKEAAAAREVEAARIAAEPAKPTADDSKDAAARAESAAKFSKTRQALAAQLGDVPFAADWQAAMAQAKSSKKPLMFFFTDKDNADGAKMGAGEFKDPKVVAAAAAFVPAVVDADADAALAAMKPGAADGK